MTTEKPAKKSRAQVIIESFIKGAVKTSAKHLGPEATVKAVEAIQKFGDAVGGKKSTEEDTTAPEEAQPEEQVSDQDLAELEELVKNSLPNQQNDSEPPKQEQQ